MISGVCVLVGLVCRILSCVVVVFVVLCCLFYVSAVSMCSILFGVCVVAFTSIVVLVVCVRD